MRVLGRVRAMMAKALLVALGLVVGAALAEVGLRALSTVHAPLRYLVTLGHSPDRPRFSSLEAYLSAQASALMPHRDFLNYWNNSLGFNDVEFTVPKPQGRFRIMALGDSFTYGLVPYPDAVMTRLEEALRAACPGRSLDLLNFGIGGLGVWDYKTLVELAAPRFEPDLVLVNFYLGNDGPDPYRASRRSRRSRRWLQRQYLVRFVGNLVTLAKGVEQDRAADSTSTVVDASRATGGAIVNPASPVPPDDRRLTGPTFAEEPFLRIMWDELRQFVRSPTPDDLATMWRPTLTILDVLRHEVTAQGRHLAIALYPSVLQVDPERRKELVERIRRHPDRPGPFPEEIDTQIPNRVLLGYCRAARISCFDLTPDLLAARTASSEPLYKTRDTHWTVRGNRVAAEAQARWLRTLVCS
jgi:hypothetical protein